MCILFLSCIYLTCIFVIAGSCYIGVALGKALVQKNFVFVPTAYNDPVGINRAWSQEGETRHQISQFGKTWMLVWLTFNDVTYLRLQESRLLQNSYKNSCTIL